MRITDQQRGRIQLADFHRLQLRPAASRASQRRAPAWLEDVFRCNLFESVCWLYLGSACEFFPPSDAQRVLEIYQDQLRSSLESYRALNRHTFTYGLEANIVAIVSGGHLSADQSIANDQSRAAFGDVLLTARRLVNDPLADVAATVLTFMPKEDWQEVLKTIPKSFYDVSALLSLDNRELAERLELDGTATAAGFLRLLEHMASSAAIFSERARTNSMMFLQALGMIQAWRLKFWLQPVRVRYYTLGEMLVECISSGNNPSKPLGIDLQEYASSLAKSWSRDHPELFSTSA